MLFFPLVLSYLSALKKGWGMVPTSFRDRMVFLLVKGSRLPIASRERKWITEKAPVGEDYPLGPLGVAFDPRRASIDQYFS